MSSARVWVMFVVASLLAQCGGAVRIGYGEWQHHRNEEITRRSDETFGIHPAPPIVPSVPVPPPVIAPPVVAPRPTGPIPLSELTQASVGAYLTSHGWQLDSTDAAPEAPVIVNVGGHRTDASLRILVVDCARTGEFTSLCAMRPAAAFVVRGNGSERLLPVITPEVTNIATLQASLRSAHVRYPAPFEEASDGMHRMSFYLDDGQIDAFDASEVVAHHGAVVQEGNALLVITVSESYLGRAAEIATELRARR